MKPRITALLACLLFAVLAPLAALGLQPKPPGPVVTTGNANLRAKPSMNAEILVSLKKDAVLVSLGESVDPKAPADEPKEWVEVAAPAGTKVWVFAALVDPTTKTIRPAKANLRAGPGRNYAEVGYALQGTAIQELRTADGWIQIAAPEGAVIGYIAKSLTKPATDKPVTPPPCRQGASDKLQPSLRWKLHRPAASAPALEFNQAVDRSRKVGPKRCQCRSPTPQPQACPRPPPLAG